jgi:peptide/nickel transport system permease protein
VIVVKPMLLPVWGGSLHWVPEPLGSLLMTGLAFALLGFALERILNPRLQTK